MSGQTILLVEDELLIRMRLSDVLGDAGYRVTEACDGDEALRILAAQYFDLLLTDVKMPGSLDGFELAAYWRDRFPNRPVLISSAHIRPDQLDPADRLITKPFTDSELLCAVEQLVGEQCQIQSADVSF